jgi:hypothetical protein
MLIMVLKKETLNKTQLEKELTEIIGKYGLKTLQKHYGSLFTGNEEQQETKKKEIPSFKELKDLFIARIISTKFKQTTRTYSSELNYFGLFTTYKLPNGLNSEISEVMNPTHISEYLSMYTNPYTWNKKAAILRSFLKMNV